MLFQPGLPPADGLAGAGGWLAGTIRIEAVMVAAAFVLAAILVKSPGRSPSGGPADRPADVLQNAWRGPRLRAWLIATLLAGATVDALIVYQVPVTVQAGLSLTVAAAVAGFRGLTQLAGRLPLTGLTGRLGARTTLILAYAVGAAASLLLVVSGTVAPALLLSLFTGASIGAIYTLQGVYAHELAGPYHLGLMLGIQQAIFAVGGAIGPVSVGALLGATGSYTPAVTIITIGFAAAAGVLLLNPSWARPDRG